MLKKINVHYHPHSGNCVTLNTSNASVCENNDSQQYNQTYSAAAYSSRPRFLTPIPKATQTISDSVHGNLSSASVSVPSIFYTNTRSLVNKMDETEVILSQTDTQIFIVSETWFHSELHDPDVNIPHYNLFTKSREDKGGGGVAVYVKNDITASPINDIAAPEELECVWVMVRPNRLPREVSAIAVCAV